MSITDVHDELDDGTAPHLIELLDQEEQVPRGRSLAAITQEDLTKLSALHFAPVTARRCEVERSQAKVLRNIREDAAMGGSDFFYSFPVKKKGGGVDYIEGISVDGAQATMQAYGNCEVDCRPIDIGHSWIFLARFIDHERGTSLIRPFIQPKTGSRLGGTDEERKIQIAFAMGASKATRNVIANAIRPYTNFCFDEARNDLVKRVGGELPKHKTRVLARLGELGVDLKRVEAQLGRAEADWTAREVAGLITQLKAIREGMTTINDVWPLAAPEPKRSEPTVAAQASAPAPPEADGPSHTTGGDTGGDPSHGSPPALTSWAVPDDVLGQPAIVLALNLLLDAAKTSEHVDEIVRVNSDRIGKFTGLVRTNWANSVRTRREMIDGNH